MSVIVKVLKSLPVTVEYGISKNVVYSWKITQVGSKPVKETPKWIYSKLSEDDIDKIELACWEDYQTNKYLLGVE